MLAGMFRLREPVNALTHWLGVLAAPPLTWALVRWAQERALPVWPFEVFGLSLGLLYAASALYHSLRPGERGQRWLRKLDHASIFLLIAGTYTPVLFYGLLSPGRERALGLVWGLAGAGVALKLLTTQLPRWVSTGLYLGLGWLALVFLPQLAHQLPGSALLWLALGGVLYSAGAVVYATKRWNPRPGVFGFHEIWHLFVLAGSASHAAMMVHLR